MNASAKIIDLPIRKSTNKKSTSKRTPAYQPEYERIKYFRKSEIQALRRTVRNQAEVALQRQNCTGVRDWVVTDILTATGLRCAEVADLRVGDIQISYGKSSLIVRNGKGGKRRVVEIPLSLKLHLKQYLQWKAQRCEPMGDDEHLILGQRGVMKNQGVQLLIKKYLKLLGLYENGKSVHALRHSYAVQLYRTCKDIRIVQRQLGHESPTVTDIYVHILQEDIQKEIKGMWSN